MGALRVAPALRLDTHILDRFYPVPHTWWKLHDLILEPLLRRIARHRLRETRRRLVVGGYPARNIGLGRIAECVTLNAAYELVVKVLAMWVDINKLRGLLVEFLLAEMPCKLKDHVCQYDLSPQSAVKMRRCFGRLGSSREGHT